MNRREKRKLNRIVKKMIAKHGDDCMSCHREHPHNSLTYIGFDDAGSLLEVGECCVSKLTEIVYKGLCVTGHRSRVTVMYTIYSKSVRPTTYLMNHPRQ
jgi:hypothetical protein